MKKTLIGIILLASFLRLFLLGSIPTGFFRDEAAIAYNSYSVWKTGADEYGYHLPLVFRSFEVFFLPLYIYLSAPIVGIFGLTVFFSRFLSAISGIFGVYLAYLIVKEIWDEKAGLIASFIVAIAPWHIFFSRGTFEGNLALTLFTAGFYFWLKFLKSLNIKKLTLSGVFFSLSMYSYQAERVVVVLFALFALIFNFKLLWKIKTKLIIPLILLLVIITPLLSLSFKAGGYHRAFGVSIFSQEKNPPGYITDISTGIFVNNRIYLRFKEISSLYLSYFSPRNLFIEGDSNPQRTVIGMSAFTAFGLIGLIYGLFCLYSKQNSLRKYLIVWLLLGPIPAALTGDPFHTYRSLLMLFPLTLIIGYGFSQIKYWKLFLTLSLIPLLFFIYNYAVITQVERARDWDYGYKEITQFVNSLPKDKKVVVDDPWTESYIEFLFYLKSDPTLYQTEVYKLGDLKNYYYTSSDRIRPHNYGPYQFRQVDWPKERGDTGTVFVIWAKSLPDSEYKTDPKVKELKLINYPDGTPAYKIVEIL